MNNLSSEKASMKNSNYNFILTMMWRGADLDSRKLEFSKNFLTSTKFPSCFQQIFKHSESRKKISTRTMAKSSLQFDLKVQFISNLRGIDLRFNLQTFCQHSFLSSYTVQIFEFSIDSFF